MLKHASPQHPKCPKPTLKSENPKPRGRKTALLDPMNPCSACCQCESPSNSSNEPYTLNFLKKPNSTPNNRQPCKKTKMLSRSTTPVVPAFFSNMYIHACIILKVRYVHTHTHIYIYMCTCVYIYTCMYVCVVVCLLFCTYVCMYGPCNRIPSTLSLCFSSTSHGLGSGVARGASGPVVWVWDSGFRA